MNIPRGTPAPAEDSAAAERARLRRVYREYERDPRYKRLWADTPAHRFMLDRKWGMIAQAVKRAGLSPETARVLDLGSGDRGDAARFGQLGVPRSGIVVFDLIPAYVRRMLDTNPSISAVTGDAASLPFTDGSFGIVYQSTMFSSLLDIDVRRAVLGEITRVLAPGGLFISYDVRYRNPWNPNTRPLKAAELGQALRGWALTINSVTGIPQLLRLLAPVSSVACRLIETIPLLRTHLLTIARKP